MAALSLLVACEVRHDYETREFSAPAAPVAGRTPENPYALRVMFPAGGVRIHAGAPDILYRASITYCAEHTIPSETPVPAGADRGAAGGVTLSLVGRPGVFIGFGGEHNTMRLDLSPVVPQLLDLDLGGGESVIDLSGIELRGLRVLAGAGDTRVIFGRPNETAADDVVIEGTVGDVGVDLLGNANASKVTIGGGVGTVDVDLTGSWRRDATVEIDASVGDLLLKLPKGANAPGVRLAVGSPWRDRMRAAGYTRRGDDYVSEGYDAAALKLFVKVLPGIGKLTVRREGNGGEASR